MADATAPLSSRAASAPQPLLFDLNIEEVLEHWEVEHALRELIANALDEQLVTSCAELTISQDDDGWWHIRDYGRGLAIEHFTLNENDEKLNGPLGTIGKFGVGLKDALATLHRRGVQVVITSSRGRYRLAEAAKHGFDDITTLHVAYEPLPQSVAITGTDVALNAVTGEQVRAAKDLFLKFAGERLIEDTPYGQILARTGRAPRVYICGVLAAEESNFLFTYNITSLTDAMRKRLNRERLNVGRTTYADRVKAILRSAESDEVCSELAAEVGARARGDQHDELSWIEISQRALNLLHQRSRVAFVTEDEIAVMPDVLDNMRRDGLQVVVVSDAQKQKLDVQFRSGDRDLRTAEGYIEQFNESFEYRFVEPGHLTSDERALLDRAPEIVDLLGPGGLRPPVLISETMRTGLDDTAGVWDSGLRSIVIKRSQLRSVTQFAGTLLHELAHARTGAVDATRTFESVLTEYLGVITSRWLADERPRATDASTLAPSDSGFVPQVAKCPHCQAANRIPRAGILRCGRCRERFEVLPDGVLRREHHASGPNSVRSI
ncbi:MAG TPA: hypothetical protein VIJ51_04425 [Solirubrobacteraceae bacterium]